MNRYDPWSGLTRPVVFADLGDLDGAYDATTDTIYLHHRLGQAGRRCTLTHELIHAERGDMSIGCPIRDGRMESSVEREAARRLVTLEHLSDVLAWTHDLDEAAEALWVDRATLEMRLASLHPSERGHLHRVLEVIDRAA